MVTKTGAKIWNLTDGSLVHHVPGKFRYLSSIALSPEGEKLAISRSDNPIRVFSVNAPVFALTGHQNQGYAADSLTFSPDGRYIAGGVKKTTVLWSANDGTLVHEQTGYIDDVYRVRFSPAGDKLVTLSGGGEVKVLDVENNTVVLDRPWGDDDYLPRMSDNGNIIAFSGGNMNANYLKVIDVDTGHLLAKLAADNAPPSITEQEATTPYYEDPAIQENSNDTWMDHMINSDGTIIVARTNNDPNDNFFFVLPNKELTEPNTLERRAFVTLLKGFLENFTNRNSQTSDNFWNYLNTLQSPFAINPNIVKNIIKGYSSVTQLYLTKLILGLTL